MKLQKRPEDCRNKEEIRSQIDDIDREIIRLFALRSEYVTEIVKFKDSPESVVAQDRRQEVIRLRGEWAAGLGLNRETFEQIYIDLIDNNIRKELEILSKR